MLSLLLPLLGTGATVGLSPEAPPACLISADIVVPLTASQVMARDVLAAAGCRDQAGSDTPIAQLPPGQAGYVLRCDQLARLAGRGAAGAGLTCGSGAERVRFQVNTTAPAGQCFLAGAEVARGSVLKVGDLRPVPCEAGVRAPRAVAARGTDLVALRDIHSEELVGPLVLPAPPVGRAGETVTGAAVFGPVLVERELELLQPAWPGRNVFARGRDGKIIVLSVPGEGEVP